MLIQIADILVEVTRKRVKNMNLRICPTDGKVKISAPLHYKDPIIKAFIEEKYSWINAQKKQMQLYSRENSFLKTGSIVSFKGKQYTLILEEQHGPAQVVCHQGFISCYIKPNAPQTEINDALNRWYRKEMSSALPLLFTHWEGVIGVSNTRWGIRLMKTRWGSCNTRTRKIWLNLNLIKKPLCCLEYVLAHELVHLHEPSHNQRFYQLMDKFMPKWRDYDYLLKGKK